MASLRTDQRNQTPFITRLFLTYFKRNLRKWQRTALPKEAILSPYWQHPTPTPKRNVTRSQTDPDAASTPWNWELGEKTSPSLNSLLVLSYSSLGILLSHLTSCFVTPKRKEVLKSASKITHWEISFEQIENMQRGNEWQDGIENKKEFTKKKFA